MHLTFVASAERKFSAFVRGRKFGADRIAEQILEFVREGREFTVLDVVKPAGCREHVTWVINDAVDAGLIAVVGHRAVDMRYGARSNKVRRLRIRVYRGVA